MFSSLLARHIADKLRDNDGNLQVEPDYESEENENAEEMDDVGDDADDDA